MHLTQFSVHLGQHSGPKCCTGDVESLTMVADSSQLLPVRAVLQYARVRYTQKLTCTFYCVKAARNSSKMELFLRIFSWIELYLFYLRRWYSNYRKDITNILDGREAFLFALYTEL